METILAASGWRTEKLLGAAATHAAVAKAIESVDLLHYAGHAVHAGIDGWESRLSLAGAEELTVGDVLALGHAPSAVVLAGCGAGHAADRDSSEVVALAHAFVVAGARIVIAPTRSVDDREAAHLVHAFYEAARTEPDWSAALRTAVVALRKDQPGADWATYRAFTP